MKNIITITALLIGFSSLIPSASFASKDCTAGADIKVNGLVCDFCARALEKVFKKQDEFESLTINLDEGLVNINYKEGKSINAERLTQLITESGYNVVDINQRDCK